MASASKPINMATIPTLNRRLRTTFGLNHVERVPLRILPDFRSTASTTYEGARGCSLLKEVWPWQLSPRDIMPVCIHSSLIKCEASEKEGDVIDIKLEHCDIFMQRNPSSMN